ncbi:hypothetical protein ACOZ0W_002107 [Cronobacter dublinensis]
MHRKALPRQGFFFIRLPPLSRHATAITDHISHPPFRAHSLLATLLARLA